MVDKEKMDTGLMLDKVKKDKRVSVGIVANIVLIIGVFLPWYSVIFLGVSSTFSPGLGDSTGILLVLMGAIGIAGLLNAFGMEPRSMGLLSFIVALVATAVVLSNYPDSELGDLVSTGSGYWMALFGALVATVASGLILFGAKKDNLPSSVDSKTKSKDE